MKLITEHTTDVRLLTEEKEGKKHFFIEGIFMQADQKNKNGRIYPYPILSNQAEIRLSRVFHFYQHCFLLQKSASRFVYLGISPLLPKH